MRGARKIASGRNAAGEEVVQILTANNALSDDTDIVSQSLYLLTETIVRGMLPDQRGGGLGGEFGYGVNFENDVFMMHRYCWCEKPDCLWCTVWLSNEVECTEEEARAHRDKQRDEIRKLYGDWAAEHPGAPHFWHKRSDLQLRWYKWIGRDMEASQDPVTDWGTIWKECWDSISEEAKAKARAEREYEETPEYKARQEEGMRLMMAAMDRMFAEQQPCYKCSMNENTFMAGGITQTGAGVKIVKVNLKDDDSCPNCGHVTTDDEYEKLAERQKIMDDDLRVRFGTVHR